MHTFEMIIPLQIVLLSYLLGFSKAQMVTPYEDDEIINSMFNSPPNSISNVNSFEDEASDSNKIQLFPLPVVVSSTTTHPTETGFNKKESNFPTPDPTIAPTGDPTVKPSKDSTVPPTKQPTKVPSRDPTIAPTGDPTIIPSKNPTISPTEQPTKVPSTRPTEEPTMKPSKVPSEHPSATPTQGPSGSPTNSPTIIPSKHPSEIPTFHPSTSIPTQAPLVCDFSWTDNSDCTSSLTANIDPEDRRIFAGQYMCSPNRQYFFGMTNDHYLAICDSNERVWSEGPYDDRNPHIVFKTDGELEVRNRRNTNSPDFKVLWSSGTDGSARSSLVLENDGTLKIINSFGELEWDAKPMGTHAPTHSRAPTVSPTKSLAPTISRSPIGSETYFPGELYVDPVTSLKLSVGLKARVIANSGKNVKYSNGSKSSIKFHDQPDAGGCFPASDGGWYYLSNSEIGGDDPDGGVGRIKFSASGDVEEYKMVLTNTRMNCGSGRTPWGTYISCEEYRGSVGDDVKKPGQCWEIHPEEMWPARATKMGGEGGKFESAAFDARNMGYLKGFITTDSKAGALYRFSPNAIAIASALVTGDYSNVLHLPGTIDYLVLDPPSKTFRWSESKEEGESSAELYFSNGEGIDVHNGMLYFTSKVNRELIILNLDTFEYTISSTKSGAFNGQPDQIVRILSDTDEDEDEEGLLYFLEDGGSNPAGVFARDRSGRRYMTILEGGQKNSDESTGLAFCDHGRRMMVAFQDEGLLYEISREDGKSFNGATVDIKYHDTLRDEL